MKIYKKLAMLFMAAALAFTCAGVISAVDDHAAITAEAASKIKLSSTKKTIGYKQSFNLSIKNTSGKMVKWSTSNKKVAKIKKVSKTKYKVTGVKPGKATIKAKVNGKTYKCKVTVDKICHTTKTMAKGTTHTLGLKGVSGTVKWSTSNKKVASIKRVSNKKYKVTAKKKGTATIKAKVDGKTLKCKVKVKKGQYTKYDIIKTEVYGCNNCGYPLFTRNSDGTVTRFSDMWSHPSCTGEVVGGKTGTCTGGICGYHNEIYEYAYCYYCGDPISYRNCQWSARCQRCANNTGNGKTVKVVINKSTDSDGSTRYSGTAYYKRCSCGKNTIMTGMDGKGLIKKN